jgi:choline dehydrogenase-like flavoprotein
MIDDARTAVEQGAVLRADVCIIGGGAAGLTIAKELSGKGIEVMVLESGGLQAERATDALQEGESVGRRYSVSGTRRRFFGGSTNCWAGLCRPLAAHDFEARPWVPHSGWPFDRNHLEPYYRRAQRVLGLGPFSYGSDRRAEGQRPALRLDGPLVSDVFQMSPPVRLGRQWRGFFERAPDVRVLLHANVTAIRLDPSAQTVRALEVRCLEGPSFKVLAQRYVLATGGLENPRLLLASNDVERRGVGNRHDLVGRYFMEHPHTDYEGLIVGSPRFPNNWDFYKPHQSGRERIWGLFRAPEQVLSRERILDFSMVLFAYDPKHDARRDHPLVEEISRVIAETDGGVRTGEAVRFTLGTPSEQAPNPESRVTLSDERDSLGVHKLVLDWRLSALDKHTIVRAHELMGQTLARAGLGRIRITLTRDDSFPRQTKGGCHHMGTTRIHPDPKRGVVDEHCYVHGVDNLIVAGSSVFPTSGAANPTLTLVALALRTADHLGEALKP